jgi:hypothetical protein
MAINCVYTHLLIGFQYFSNNQILIQKPWFWKLKKVKELSTVSSIFLGQFFHENHLFVEAFEIVIKINGYFIFPFFKKPKLMIPRI